MEIEGGHNHCMYCKTLLTLADPENYHTECHTLVQAYRHRFNLILNFDLDPFTVCPSCFQVKNHSPLIICQECFAVMKRPEISHFIQNFADPNMMEDYRQASYFIRHQLTKYCKQLEEEQNLPDTVKVYFCPVCRNRIELRH